MIDYSKLVFPGDILAVRGKGWASREILKLTGNTVSHVGLVVANDPVPLVTEALWRVKTHPIENSVGGTERSYILHPKNLTRAQTQAIIRGACGMSADGYGLWDLGLQLIDVTFKTTWPTDHALALGLNQHPICSYLVAAAYGDAGLTFGMKLAQSISPADEYNFAVGNPDKYDVWMIYPTVAFVSGTKPSRAVIPA